MGSDDNGFAGMADYLGKLSDVAESNITLKSLEKAAIYYVEKMLPNIPKNLKTKKHMRDHVKVVIENQQIRVVFEDTAFYWRFVENGTINQRAQHFASGAYAQNKAKIESLMSEKILKELRK